MSTSIRAIYRACSIDGAPAPYDRITMKVYYPADRKDSPEERNTGVIPVDTRGAPYPVVVFMRGINLGPEGCAWLAMQLVAAGFVRIVTQARFPGGPTPLAQALATIDSLSALEHCHWVNPGRRHWELVSGLCRQCGSQGKHVADAAHAAVAIEHSCQWVTRDNDFQLFAAHGLQLELLEP